MYLQALFFKFKYFVRYNIPESLWQFLAFSISSLRSKQYSESHKTFGLLNPDIIFYVIRRRPPAWGFFSNFNFVLQGILYAEEHNFIPIVDMQNYWVAELSTTKKINESFNAWCYFFEQISEYSLEEVYRSKNVILSNAGNILSSEHWFSDRKLLFAAKPESLEIISKIINKYINVNKITLDHFKNMKKELNFEPTKTIGVFIRGTSYIFYKGVQAPVPKLDNIILALRRIVKETSINNLYISTEDYKIYVALCNEFNDKCIIPSIRYENGLTIKEWEDGQKLTLDGAILAGYELTLKYLEEMLLLSECQNFITTLSNASVFVLSERRKSHKQSNLILQDEIINL